MQCQLERELTMSPHQDIIKLDLINDEHELFIPESDLESQLERSAHLPSLELKTIDLQWMQVLSEGWATPLKVKNKSTQFCLKSIINVEFYLLVGIHA